MRNISSSITSERRENCHLFKYRLTDLLNRSIVQDKCLRLFSRLLRSFESFDNEFDISLVNKTSNHRFDDFVSSENTRRLSFFRRLGTFLFYCLPQVNVRWAYKMTMVRFFLLDDNTNDYISHLFLLLNSI